MVRHAPGRASNVWACESERLAPALVPESTESQGGRAGASRSARILVIDDEFRVRRVITKTLTRAQHRVVDVASAEAALDVLRADSDFDLILSDMVMPQMSGAQLFDRLLDERPELAKKFVFVSGGSASGSEAARLREKAVRLLLKPFTPDELLRFVAEQLELQSR